MKVSLEQTQKHQLILTESMQQSLKLLSMPSFELRAFLTDYAYSNPVIDIESLSCAESPQQRQYSTNFRISDDSGQFNVRNGEAQSSFEDFCFHKSEETLESVLLEQLNDSGIEGVLYSICKYIILCINSQGYLEIPLEEIAAELNADPAVVTQALYAVQTFSPCGVAARDLQECLLLQLAQTRHFGSDTVHLIKYALPLLAQNNISAISEKLGISRERTKKACNAVRSLNPIPSSGFSSGLPTVFIVPDAYVHVSYGEINVELNRNAYPRLNIVNPYANTETDEALKEYLDEQLKSAGAIIDSLNKRELTLSSVIVAIVKRQNDYFSSCVPLQPMTMTDIAQELNLSISTVSRAVHDKYIHCASGVISLKSLFSNNASALNDCPVSADEVKKKILYYVENESKSSPLSDEAIRTALSVHNINVSRRTIAKYRAELRIPSSSSRMIK